MIVIDIAGTRWFGASRLFPSGDEARAAYLAIGDFDRSGHLDIGVYRHQRVGLDTEPVLVSIVGMRREGVEQAERLIGGEEVEQHPDTWTALIARRVRVVVEHHEQGQRAGRYEKPHPPGGEQLMPDGRIE